MTDSVDAIVAYQESLELNKYYINRNLALAGKNVTLQQEILQLESERQQLFDRLNEMQAEIEAMNNGSSGD